MGHTADMMELTEYEATLFMDGIGDFLPPFDMLL
jgi:hypothetical protein